MNFRSSKAKQGSWPSRYDALGVAQESIGRLVLRSLVAWVHAPSRCDHLCCRLRAPRDLDEPALMVVEEQFESGRRCLSPLGVMQASPRQ